MTKKLTTKEFISKAVKIHGDTYDYSKVVYEKSCAKVIVICKEHGEFAVTPNNHLKGKRCGICGARSGGNKNKLTTDEFIKKSKELHGDKYDYSKTVYTSANSRVLITCPTHGYFMQLAETHMKTSGCPECGKIKAAEKRRSTTKEFIEKSVTIHGNRFDYSNTTYTSNHNKVKIICSVHGEFEQLAHNHLSGRGCHKCRAVTSSKEKDIIEFIKNYYHVDTAVRGIIGKKELDCYIPEKKIAIEYNGIIWHSEKFHKDPINHMLNKQKACAELGIRLIHIMEYEDTGVVKKTLAHILGIEKEKYYARNCETLITTSSDQRVKKFMLNNHLQGNAEGCWAGCLLLNGQIVCAMLFSRTVSERGCSDTTRWELRRFASVCRVVGGASRLLKLFIKNVECETVISYSDNRWFTGEMYEKLGFTMVGTTKPDYKYVKSGVTRAINKSMFSRKNMARRADIVFRKDESERINAMRNGWYRLYDCGKKKWELKTKSPAE